MPLCEKPVYIHEPTPLQCGQAVLSMLSGETVDKIIKIVGTERETDLKMMYSALDKLGIAYEKNRVPVSRREDLPEICFLSLETPRCWHWSLYFKGKFFDPEHGVLDDFPEAKRKYYWKIISDDIQVHIRQY